MKVVPQAFYENPSINKILVDGLCAVLFKRVAQANEQQERYLSAHAFTLVTSGTLRVSNLDGDFVHVPENHLVFLPKGLYMVTDLLPQNAPFEGLVCFVDDDLLADFRSGGPTMPPKLQEKRGGTVPSLPLVMPFGKEVQMFVTNLLELYDGERSAPVAVTRPKLLEFLHLLGRLPEASELHHRLEALSQRQKKSLVEFMEANYAKPLKIEDFAYLTGRSVSTFHRDFKARFQAGPKQWIIDRRMEKAKNLLGKGKMKVAEVAKATGYENVPHFIKSFRRRYGVSPGQFGIQQRSEAFF